MLVTLVVAQVDVVAEVGMIGQADVTGPAVMDEEEGVEKVDMDEGDAEIVMEKGSSSDPSTLTNTEPTINEGEESH